MSAPYILKEWMDFDETCTDTSFGQESLDAGDNGPICKVTESLRMLKNDLFMHDISWRNGSGGIMTKN